jgi:4-diphosphocytidyl-2-C-methyl-D-erythritol kinase
MQCASKKAQNHFPKWRMISEFAPAKINLALHVTGRRPDGYHLLDSLVVFADIGDEVSFSPSDQLSLEVTGPQASCVPTGADNLVLRAAQLMAQGRGGAITLTKNLPVASGIGGGSADAAACLRAAARFWDMPLPDPDAVLRLGADLPVCLLGQPCRMQGVGETLTPLAKPLPPSWLVLVNPGIAIATPTIFRALTQRENPPLPASFPLFSNTVALAAFLHQARNDLEPAATRLAPVIARSCHALRQQNGCHIARMSGSGATCFGLFSDRTTAQVAADALQKAYPSWWIKAAAIRPLAPV